MKVLIDLLRESEGKVTYAEKEKRLVVEPKFRMPHSIQPIGYVSVMGNSGAVKRFVLVVAGATGKVSAQEVTDVESLFDRPESEQKMAAVQAAGEDE
jgi:hypothetical protein